MSRAKIQAWREDHARKVAIGRRVAARLDAERRDQRQEAAELEADALLEKMRRERREPDVLHSRVGHSRSGDGWRGTLKNQRESWRRQREARKAGRGST
jgi:hypothetical protein